MIAVWIAIGIVAALGLVTVYACIVAGSDADDESETPKWDAHTKWPKSAVEIYREQLEEG
mgnify:CR=1 FL=1